MDAPRKQLHESTRKQSKSLRCEVGRKRGRTLRGWGGLFRYGRDTDRTVSNQKRPKRTPETTVDTKLWECQLQGEGGAVREAREFKEGEGRGWVRVPQGEVEKTMQRGGYQRSLVTLDFGWSYRLIKKREKKKEKGEGMGTMGFFAIGPRRWSGSGMNGG